ncbi:MAG: hypothetical protein ABIO04_14155 [Ferruginibacter sp.]
MKLEDFISAYRNEFDDLVPSEKVWAKIDAAFSPKKRSTLNMPVFKWSMAAAAILILGFVLYFQPDKKIPVAPVIVKNEQDINKLAPEYAPQVNEFAKLIDMKQEELKLLAKEQPALYQQFSNDITQLDSSYNTLKNQLSINPNKEMLIEAMIQNLQLQLSVLNQQLNIIIQIKQTKKYSHEKNYQKI